MKDYFDIEERRVHSVTGPPPYTFGRLLQSGVEMPSALSTYSTTLRSSSEASSATHLRRWSGRHAQWISTSSQRRSQRLQLDGAELAPSATVRFIEGDLPP